jgi:hypothetical protein
MAFPSVVAGGPDACTIHYSRADKVGHVAAGFNCQLADYGLEVAGNVHAFYLTEPVMCAA